MRRFHNHLQTPDLSTETAQRVRYTPKHDLPFAATEINPFRRVLIANRGEIAIRIGQACAAVGMESVAVFSDSDRGSLHTQRLDQAVRIGGRGSDIGAYLDADEVIRVAQQVGADAVHPGYGFLSENPAFAAACTRAGLTFIGPTARCQRILGDKVSGRALAQAVNVPVLPGSNLLTSLEAARTFAETQCFPLMVKAVAGGGGRGIRRVDSVDELDALFDDAAQEAEGSFGQRGLFLERYLSCCRHIEVQVIGDHYGALRHLYDRDCSVQRRNQKLIECAPAPGLSDPLRSNLHQWALDLARAAKLHSLATIEFLITPQGEAFFIEANPRIQVEHTVTEEALGLDLVTMQLRIAEGYPLESQQVGLPPQQEIRPKRAAIQCRINAEDPAKSFMPADGQIESVQWPTGPGVRLDVSMTRPGTRIGGGDSLIGKVTVSAPTYAEAVSASIRALQQVEVNGIPTTAAFLQRVLQHDDFDAGRIHTHWVDEQHLLAQGLPHSSLERAVNYLAHRAVVPWPDLRAPSVEIRTRQPEIPVIDTAAERIGSRDRFVELGVGGLQQWIRRQQQLLLVDSTMRDANQSLLASRLRTQDMLQIAEATGHLLPDYFALEVWGGSNFDIALRELKEDPFERLHQLRQKIPHILFQALMRGANTVGYVAYPDNMVRRFISRAHEAGVDLFRVMDPLNWTASMKVAMESVNEAGGLCEAAICYAGNILDPKRDKYPLKQYVDLAKELERMGAAILGIKDMAGILKPMAARKLVRALRDETDLPIHLHSHDTSGNANLVIREALDAGADIADTALSAMSGLTGMPSANSLVASFEGDPRQPLLDPERLQQVSDYWETVRSFYEPFETGLKASSAAVYCNEIPGGQYASLRIQAEKMGMGDRWHEVVQMYCRVSEMFGDPIKATPLPKMIGDTALLMVQNRITPEQVLSGERPFGFTREAMDYLDGTLGQPPGGLPEKLQTIALQGRQPTTCRAGDLLAPVDFEASETQLADRLGRRPTEDELMSWLTFPEAFDIYQDHQQQWGDLSFLPTPLFFYGLQPGEAAVVPLTEGGTAQIQLIAVGAPDAKGECVVCLEVDGAPRHLRVLDPELSTAEARVLMADPGDSCQIGAPTAGQVVKMVSAVGDWVDSGAIVCQLEAMKMALRVPSTGEGRVKAHHVAVGDPVVAGQLLVTLEAGEGPS